MDLKTNITWSSPYMQKSLWQNRACLHDKNSRKYRTGRSIPQHNKSYVWEIHSQNNSKCRRIWRMHWNQEEDCLLYPLLFSIMFEALSETLRERNLSDTNKKNKSKYLYFQVTWYEILEIPKFLSENFEKWYIQKCSRMKNKFAQINSFSIYQQQTYRIKDSGRIPIHNSSKKIK